MGFQTLHEEVARILNEAEFRLHDLQRVVPQALMLRLKKKGIDTDKAVVDAINNYPINPSKLQTYFKGPFEQDLADWEAKPGYISRDETAGFWDAKIGALSNVATGKPRPLPAPGAPV